jgi:hypothetical protein
MVNKSNLIQIKNDLSDMDHFFLDCWEEMGKKINSKKMKKEEIDLNNNHITQFEEIQKEDRFNKGLRE